MGYFRYAMLRSRLIELLNELLNRSIVRPSLYCYDPTSLPVVKGSVLSFSMVSRGEDTRL